MRAGVGPIAAGLAALALVAAAGAIANQRQREAASSPIPTVENGGPRGFAAARAWLVATGRPHRVIRPGGAGPSPGEVALLLAPRAPLGEDAAAGLVLHAERGGTVVWAMGATAQPALEARLGVARAAPPGVRALHRSAPLAPHPLLAGLELLTRGGALRQARPDALSGLPIAGDTERTVAMSVPRGAGEAIVLAGPDALENAGLGEGDHLALLSRLASLGPLAFDERFLAAPEPVAGPSRLALALLLGQALVAAGVLLLALGRRLGAVRVDVAAAEVRTSGDYLASLADLYRRAGAERELTEEAWRLLRRTLESRAGIPASAPVDEAASRLEARRPGAGPALRRAAEGRAAGSLLATTRASSELDRLLGRASERVL